jgi:folate-dependent phosphoribosylglycinamide formyltransferase PurN
VSSPFRLAVLASGNGSNLQAIIDHLHRRPLGVPAIDQAGCLVEAPTIEVALVVSDTPGAGGGGGGGPPPN